jgi:hypothetical protein
VHTMNEQATDHLPVLIRIPTHQCPFILRTYLEPPNTLFHQPWYAPSETSWSSLGDRVR